MTIYLITRRNRFLLYECYYAGHFTDGVRVQVRVQDLLWKENTSRQEQLLIPAAVSPQVTIKFSGSPIYSAAALSLEPRQEVAKACIGVFLQLI
jgi:hypothetical protein